jgi:hypothetical protein
MQAELEFKIFDHNMIHTFLIKMDDIPVQAIANTYVLQ